MAAPKTASFGKFLVYIARPSAPDTWLAPCGFTSRAFRRTKDTTDTVVPDCDDPDLPADIERVVKSKSWQVTGEGVGAADAQAIWDEFFDDGDAWPIKIEFAWPSPTGTIAYTGAGHLTQLEMTGAQGDKVKQSVTIVSDGALTRSPAL